MNSRPFSNNTTISYNDYISNKKCITNKLNQNRQRIYANYANLSQFKNRRVINCPPFLPCLASPLTIIQANSSYICENVIKDTSLCLGSKLVLYPYGHYLCQLNTCNTNITST